MSIQNILNDFDLFAKNVYDTHMPKSSEGTPGTTTRMKSYLEDLKNKLPEINSELTNKMNRILEQTLHDPSIDIEKLKEDLFSIVHKRHDEWMTEHKPR